MKNRNNVYSGTSGLALPESNKQSFPAEFRDKSRLAYYASLFNSVEINSSFKKLPMARTVEKWSSNVPDNFQFTFKCWKGITHNKGLQFNEEDVDHFFAVVNHMGNKKGCLLFQFPGKLSITYKEQLEKLLTIIRQNNPEHHWKIALEFRNTSWYLPDVFELLHQNNTTLVLHDLPSSAPQSDVPVGPFVYLRFHGPEKGYRGSYPDPFLFTYAQRITAWIEDGKDVYVYFNNTLGNAAGNLKKLNSLIYSAGKP